MINTRTSWFESLKCSPLGTWELAPEVRALVAEPRARFVRVPGAVCLMHHDHPLFITIICDDAYEYESVRDTVRLYSYEYEYV